MEATVYLILGLFVVCVKAVEFKPLGIHISGERVLGQSAILDFQYLAEQQPELYFMVKVASEDFIVAQADPDVEIMDNFLSGTGSFRLSIPVLKPHHLKYKRGQIILAKIPGKNYYWSIRFYTEISPNKSEVIFPDVELLTAPPKQAQFRDGRDFKLKCALKVKGQYVSLASYWSTMNDRYFENPQRTQPYTKKARTRNRSDGSVVHRNQILLSSPAPMDQGLYRCYSYVTTPIPRESPLYGEYTFESSITVITVTDVTDATAQHKGFTPPLPSLKISPEMDWTMPKGIFQEIGADVAKPWYIRVTCWGYGSPNITIALHKNGVPVTRASSPNIFSVSLKVSAFLDRVLFSIDCRDVEKCRGDFNCVSNNGAGSSRSTPTWRLYQ